jgi:hypothetical protein
MRRHTKWYNIIKLVEIVEFSSLVAVVTVED